jgi:glycosyltransferase involved in cell wall biosynthesis
VPLQEDNTERLIDSLNPLTWLQVGGRIARQKPDLVIIPWWVFFWAPQFSTIALLVKVLTDTEIIFLCHNVVEHEPRFWKRFVTKVTFMFADRFVTHSRHETEKLRQLLGDNIKVATAFHPTYADLASKTISKENAKERLGLSGPALLFFGFIREYKGLEILLKALPNAIKEHDITLLVVGEFWKDKQKYLDMIKELRISDAVMIIDKYVPNEGLGFYFKAADLVVQPYLSVSGSGVCQLAYGFGRPVIATDVGNLSEVIEDRINGRIIPPGDPQALAEAIAESLQPDVLELYTANAKKVTDKFSWEVFVDIVVGSARRGNTK